MTTTVRRDWTAGRRDRGMHLGLMAKGQKAGAAGRAQVQMLGRS